MCSLEINLTPDTLYCAVLCCAVRCMAHRIPALIGERAALQQCVLAYDVH